MIESLTASGTGKEGLFKSIRYDRRALFVQQIVMAKGTKLKKIGIGVKSIYSIEFIRITHNTNSPLEDNNHRK